MPDPELQELRREIQDVRKRVEERERAAPPVPKGPRAEPKTVARELDDAVTQAVGPRERPEREKGLRAPPSPPPTKWWLDADARDEVKQRAEQIAVREGVAQRPVSGVPMPTTVPEPPVLRGRIPALEQVSGPAYRPTISETVSEVGRRVSTGVPGIGVPPPSFESPLLQRPRPYTPEYMAEGLKEFGARLAGHFAAPAVEGLAPIIGPVSTEKVVGLPGGRWAAEAKEPLPEEYTRVSVPISPRAAWRRLKASPIQAIRSTMGAVEALTDVGMTALMETAMWVERGIGEIGLRNMREPSEIGALGLIGRLARLPEKMSVGALPAGRRGGRWSAERPFEGAVEQPAIPGRWIDTLTPKGREDIDRYKAEYKALYDTVQGLESDPELKDRSLAEAARAAYSGPRAMNAIINRTVPGEDPDTVVAEEMDPIAEAVGQSLLDPINWIGGWVGSSFKSTKTLERNTAFWMEAMAQDPDILSFVGRKSKDAAEFFNPFAPLRSTRAAQLSDAVTGVLNHVVNGNVDNPAAITAALRELGEDFSQVGKYVAIEPGSEGGRMAEAVFAELFSEDEIKKLVSLKPIKPVTAALPGMEAAEAAEPFNVATFWDEMTPKIEGTTRKMMGVALDKPAQYNIPGRIAPHVKREVSDVYLGVNPGYFAGRNPFNNFSTELVDNLIDPRTLIGRPDNFMVRWGQEKIVGMRRGLGTMADITRGTKGHIPGLNWLAAKGHAAAAWGEDFARRVGFRKALGDFWQSAWQKSNGRFYPNTLQTYVAEQRGLQMADEMAEVVNSVGRNSLNEDEFQRYFDIYWRSGRAPIAGAAEEVPPIMPPFVSEFADEGVPGHVIDEAQEWTDDLARGDISEAEYVAHIEEMQRAEDVGLAFSRQRDGLYWDVGRGAVVPGPVAADLPRPIHTFPGDIISIEARLVEEKGLSLSSRGGLGLQDAQPYYREAIAKGRPWASADEIKKITWDFSLVGEEEKAYYTRALLADLKKSGGYLEPQEAKYLGQPEDEIMLYMRSPVEWIRGPLDTGAVDRKAGEFVRAVRASSIADTDNARAAQLLGLNEDEARQVLGNLQQRGAVAPAWGREGYREVLCLEGSADAGSQVQSIEAKIQVLEGELAQGKYRAGRGGRLAASDEAALEHFKQDLSFLRGETDDIPYYEDLVSPWEATPSRVDEVQEMVDSVDELGEDVDSLKARLARARGDLEDLEEEARSLPSTRVTRRYRNLRTGEALPSPGTGKGGRVPWDRQLDEWRASGVPVDSYFEQKWPGYAINDEDAFVAVVERVWKIPEERTSLRKEIAYITQRLGDQGVSVPRPEDIFRKLRRVGAEVMEEAETQAMDELRLRARVGALPGDELNTLYESARITGDDAEELVRMLGTGTQDDYAEAMGKGLISEQDYNEAFGLADVPGVTGAEHARRSAELNRGLEEEIARREAEAGAAGARKTDEASRLIDQLESPPTAHAPRISDAQAIRQRITSKFLKDVGDGVPPRVRTPAPTVGDFSDEMYKAIMDWKKEHYLPSLEGAKLVGETQAAALVDFALLDYRIRKNADLWLSWFVPYHYWPTRNMWNWTQRMATKPWFFATNVRLQKALRESNADLPTRLRNSVGVPASVLAEWMGDKLYIDASPNFFAPNNLWPWRKVGRINYSDPVEARSEYEEFNDLFQEVQMRPYFYMDVPFRYVSGTTDELYYFAPLTAGVKGLTSIAREFIPALEEFIPPGGINIEAGLRQAMGMPRAYFTEETYWPAQSLAFMVATGEMTDEEAWNALEGALVRGEKDTPAWQKAYQRGAVQRGFSQLGSFFLGQPMNIQQKGEEIMRGWSEELDELGWSPERPTGSAQERFEYLDAHPAMAIRSAVFSYSGPKAWMYKKADGSTDVEAYKQAVAEFDEAGGGAAALERRYQMRKYGVELGGTQALKAEMENQLIKDGMVPGTRAFKVWDDWFREQVEDPLYGRYERYFTEGAGEPPYRASPRERLAWMQDQRVKALGEVYYAITPDQYANAEGEIDWDTFLKAREAAVQSLPPEDRGQFIQYLHRTWIPEEEGMTAVEIAVYQPIMELIGAMSAATPEEKKLLQGELDALKKLAPDAAEAALLDAIDQIVALHPDWGQEERNRLLDFKVPSLETWQRSSQAPRPAFEGAFKSFYWGLDAGTRRVTHDQRWAEQAGVPGSYLGAEFEAYVKANPKLENLDDISDEQLLQWLSQTGQLLMLAEEGFPVPGQPLRGVLARIPGYEERVVGAEYDFTGVEGRAGARLSGAPGLPGGFGEGLGPRLPTAEAPTGAPLTRTEELEGRMRQAVADAAVQGEEQSELELVDPTFKVPAEGVVDEMSQAYAEMDAYWAAKDAGLEAPDWSPLMEKWFGDPNSAQSQWWKAYKEWRAPTENNPMGWGLLPDEIKENPFVKMVFDSMEEGAAEVDEDVYLEARLAVEEYIAAHGEELTQAREEYVGYLATLNVELEELQDQYYEFPQGSQERRDFIKAHPELDAYWEGKRAYKDAHPVMVRYYFPPREGDVAYQPRGTYRGWGGGGGGRRRGAAAKGPEWGAFASSAGPELVGVLIAYWGGQAPLSPAALSYLQTLFKANSYGAANFETWLELLRTSWQASLSALGGYEIPMRKRPVIVQPAGGQQGFNAPGRPPTRVRYLRT